MKTITITAAILWYSLAYVEIQREKLQDQVNAYQAWLGTIQPSMADKHTREIICAGVKTK